ncbi:hypothetical protein HIM_02619 [Hirsutella minnesotensis 3608]|nr:hypothetical protein HIM_02619 [Hirsutella minnesotensis 3608]
MKFAGALVLACASLALAAPTPKQGMDKSTPPAAISPLRCQTADPWLTEEPRGLMDSIVSTATNGVKLGFGQATGGDLGNSIQGIVSGALGGKP